eukprot:Opistho-2@45268
MLTPIVFLQTLCASRKSRRLSIVRRLCLCQLVVSPHPQRALIKDSPYHPLVGSVPRNERRGIAIENKKLESTCVHVTHFARPHLHSQYVLLHVLPLPHEMLQSIDNNQPHLARIVEQQTLKIPEERCRELRVCVARAKQHLLRLHYRHDNGDGGVVGAAHRRCFSLAVTCLGICLRLLECGHGHCEQEAVEECAVECAVQLLAVRWTERLWKNRRRLASHADDESVNVVKDALGGAQVHTLDEFVDHHHRQRGETQGCLRRPLHKGSSRSVVRKLRHRIRKDVSLKFRQHVRGGRGSSLQNVIEDRKTLGRLHSLNRNESQKRECGRCSRMLGDIHSRRAFPSKIG